MRTQPDVTPARQCRACVLALALAAVLALTACDPVGWLRRVPPSPTASLVAPAPSSTPVSVDASCRADPAESDSVATAPAARPGSGTLRRLVAAAGRRVVQLGSATYGLRDFAVQDGTMNGGLVGPAAAGLRGAGVLATTLQLVPHSSTRAATIPTTFPDTNRLSVLRVTGSARVLGDFTMRGTSQGHLYNGLRVDHVRGLRAADLRIIGIPGGDDAPPGETFGINDYRTTGSRWARVEVDGAGVGGAGFGANGSIDVRICDSRSHDNAHSMGFAFWQVRDIDLVDCSAVRNGGAGFNFERVAGSVRLVRPKARDNAWDMRIASDRGSAAYAIVDPVLTGGRWTIAIPRTYYGSPNLQRRADVRLTVRGKDRPDLIRWVVP